MNQPADTADRLRAATERLSVARRDLLSRGDAANAARSASFFDICAEIEQLLAEMGRPSSVPEGTAAELRLLIEELDDATRRIRARLKAAEILGAALRASFKRSALPTTYGMPLNGAVSVLRPIAQRYI